MEESVEESAEEVGKVDGGRGEPLPKTQSKSKSPSKPQTQSTPEPPRKPTLQDREVNVLQARAKFDVGARTLEDAQREQQLALADASAAKRSNAEDVG